MDNLRNYKVLIILLIFVGSINAITVDDLYNFHDKNNIYLPHGNSSFEFISLDTPINFYSTKYDHIYINANGILTFVSDFAEYYNQPFPLEYPAIAAFYSKVDTTGANASTNIIFTLSYDPGVLERATLLVQSSFSDADYFSANVVYLATWQNVGRANANSQQFNTFQIAIICDQHESYVQFLYPDNGLNWLQAEVSEFELPHIRAQAGFMSEDGRHFNLEGSGTYNVRFLTSNTNIGIPGIWLYHVGYVGPTENIEQPNNIEIATVRPEPTSCSSGGYQKCHIFASCKDTGTGFCCSCNEGYYGNGFECINSTTPLRVRGSIKGSVNNITLTENVKIQYYVTIADGRTFTALNPIDADFGNQLRMLIPLGSSVGWLFAKPFGSAKNGYQLTGGHLTQTTKLKFKDSDDEFYIEQSFNGLDYWDHLNVDIEISGHLPYIPPEKQIIVDDYLVEFVFHGKEMIFGRGNAKIQLESDNETSIEFDISEEIHFKSCPFAKEADNDAKNLPVLQKVSKIFSAYHSFEKAIRIGFVTKIGIDPTLNACTDGTVTCGQNMLCIPGVDDHYNCVCKNGFQIYQVEGSEYCVDIDECDGSNYCSEYARCVNRPGGYDCVCFEGFEGDGHTCTGPELDNRVPYDHPHETQTTDRQPWPEHYPAEKEEDRHHYDRHPPHYPSTETTNYPSENHHDNRHEDRYDNRPPYDHGNRHDDRQDERQHDPNQYRHDQENSHDNRYNERDGDRYDVHNEVDTDDDMGHTEYYPNRHDYDHGNYPYSGDHELTNCDRCHRDASCMAEICICNDGWTGDGFYCIPECQRGEIWMNNECVLQFSLDDLVHDPYCNEHGKDCTCPKGFGFIEGQNLCRLIISDSEDDSRHHEPVPCDVQFNCHPNATCEWSEEEYRYMCVCQSTFAGDGFYCEKIDVSCATQEDICDEHAACVYIESLGQSQCQCRFGYEGDGYTCQLVPDCTINEHCTANSYCDNGICQCIEGYERDNAQYCVPVGFCGGTYCAENAICRWDGLQKVQYCDCIEGYTGDGIVGCKSIPVPCNVRNNCGLNAACIPNYKNFSVFECICDSGYYGDGFNCIEEKTCRNTPNLCDPNAKCEITVLGLQCVCQPGFIGNGSYCKQITQHESGFLLISQGVVVLRLPFNGKVGKPISIAQMAIGLDKDCSEGRVYWGDISSKKIMTSTYDGKDSKPFISEDVISPEGIAVDWLSRRIYWTDSTKDTIEVASLDNPYQRAVIIKKHLVNPRGIAVDPHKNKLYWSDWNRESPKIEVSELDGTGREILLTKPSVVLPNSLVVLPSTGELCFADAGTQKIECYDTYLKTLRTVAGNLSYPFGLASAGNEFYWTDWTTKQIESVDALGKRKPSIRTPVFGSHKMYGMTAITDYCPVSYSPCQINNGGCPDDRICLVNRNAPSTKSCKCTTKAKKCLSGEMADD